MSTTEPVGSLLAKTRELLTGKDLISISHETGLPFYWLRSLATTENPSVNRVQTLYEYLTKRTLKV